MKQNLQSAFQARNLKAKDINGKSGELMIIFFNIHQNFTARSLHKSVADVRGQEGWEEKDDGLQV